MKDYGFIIIRNVNSIEQNNLWIECYYNIRKFYNDVDILIVDNNSNLDFVSTIDLHNCVIIHSEFYESRQLSAYYYHKKLKLFDKAIIIHDSVIINKYIDFDKINCDIKYIWNFNTHLYDNENEEMYLLNKLKNNEELIHMYTSNKWKGCLGNMSIISQNFLQLIDEKYNFLSLVNVIKNNAHQCALESVFSVICYCNEDEKNLEKCLIGEISELKWGYSYKDYMKDKNNNCLPENYIKIFAARQ